MDDGERLFKNNFIKTLRDKDIPSDKKEDFKRYYENKLKEQQKKTIIKQTENIKSSGKKQTTNSKFNSNYNDFLNFDNNNKNNNIKIERHTVVSIDTRDRDINKFPKQNTFKAFLGKNYLNVKKIELVSTEFPNTDQVIKDLPVQLQNNMITWQNEEDKDLNFFKGLIINTVIQDFIDITLVDHGYTINSTLNVSIYNSKLDSQTTVSNLIDGMRQVTVIDKDTFRFEYKGGIQEQGTASIDLGYPTYQVFVKPGNYTATTLASQIEKDLKLVKRRNGTGQFHFFEVKINLDTDVMTLDSVIESQLPNNSISTIAGSTTITVNQPGHGFKNGERVKMIGVKSFAGINSSVFVGDFFVKLVDFNTFTYEINTKATETTEGGGNTIRTGKNAPFRLLFDTTNTRIQYNTGFPDEDSSEPINSINPLKTKALAVSDVQIISNSKIRITTQDDHGLNSATIKTIDTIQAGSPPTVTTLTPHGIQLPSVITLRNTNTVPKLNGSFFCFPTGEFTFTVKSSIIAVSGNSGEILYGNDKVKIFGLKSVPNILIEPIFFVENIPSQNEFDISFRAESIDAKSIPDTIIGTSQITVNHPEHGFNKLSSISPDGAEFANIKTFLTTDLVGSRRENIVIEEGPSGSNTVDILVSNHGVETSEEIIIINSNTDPIVNGRYKVQKVDNDLLRINFVFSSFITGTGTILNGDIVTISGTNSSPKIDGTYSIENRQVINSISTGTVTSILSTQEDHHYGVGDIITISGTNSTPDINGQHTIQSVINNTAFEIDLEQPVVNAGTSGIVINNNRFRINTGFEILTPGSLNAGIIGRSNNIIHYRVRSIIEGSDNIAGIPLREINNNKRVIFELIDRDNYIIMVNGQYAEANVVSGGDSIKVSSNIHGLKTIQANTDTGDLSGELFRSISLEGQNYVYMTAESDGVQLDTVFNTANISNTFAKILLSESPGNLMFNSFVSEAKVFDNPIAKINEMKFKILTPEGFLFNFNDIDFSFTLRITELVDQLDNAYISSRTGTTEFSNLIGGGTAYKSNTNLTETSSSKDISKSKVGYSPLSSKVGNLNQR